MMSVNRAVTLTKFRENPGKFLTWVEDEGGHVWLTRHGKHVAAVIPFHEMKVLEALLGQSETARVEQIEKEYRRFRSAKAVQAHEERARLSEGKQVGGGETTARKARMVDQGRDPWTDDPVLITPGTKRVLRFHRPEGEEPGA